MCARKRLVVSKTTRVFSTYDDRIGKVASQLFKEEQQFYNQQRRDAKVKSWEKLCELINKECLPMNTKQEVVDLD